MNALLLGGNSQRNKEWVHEVGSSVSDLFDATVVHDYTHWETGDEMVDIDAELPKVISEISGHEPYVIFAKSIGSVLCLKGMIEGTLTPKAAVFVGLPLKVIAEMELPVQDWLGKVIVPATFLHNTDDPIGTYEQAAAYVNAVNNPNLQIIETPGSDHSYDNIELIHQLLEKIAT